jgi:hypothetical protein
VRAPLGCDAPFSPPPSFLALLRPNPSSSASCRRLALYSQAYATFSFISFPDSSRDRQGARALTVVGVGFGTHKRGVSLLEICV